MLGGGNYPAVNLPVLRLYQSRANSTEEGMVGLRDSNSTYHTWLVRDYISADGFGRVFIYSTCSMSVRSKVL